MRAGAQVAPLKQCKKGCLAPNLHRWPRKQFNGLDQKLYEKMTASIKNVKTSYVTVKTTSKTKKLSLKQRNDSNQLKETLAKENETEPRRALLKGRRRYRI